MPHNQKYILSIDMGTSGPKVALATTTGDILAYEFEETPLILLPKGGAEQRPGDWWNAIVKAAHRVLAQRLAPIENIVAVNASTHWSGTVAVDRSGQPLMNSIIWMDTRGAPHVARITDGLIKIEGYEIFKMLRWISFTGGGPAKSGKDSLAHILHIQHDCPDVYRATHKFLEPKDYLNYRLTGRLAASYDSIALHWVTDNRDLSRVTYVPELIRYTGLDHAKLPDLQPANSILGPLSRAAAAELGLSPNTQVVIGTGDITAAAIGSGAVRDYEAHLYIGTSSWITCHVPFKKTDLTHNMASLPSANPARYFIANDQETAGACLTYLRDKLFYRADEPGPGTKPANVYKLFDHIAERTPAGSDKLIFTPWLYGERTPVENHSLRGGFFNQSLAHTRDHLVRAVFEGVAYNTRWLFTYVEKFINRRIDSLNFIGGGANSNVWCQIHADVLDRPIRQAADPILANARGTAILASVALGQMTFDDAAKHTRIARIYEPDPANRKIYDELFTEFLNIYA
ncbi:MAG TPA: FGGY-family carbohydrate kinase, partial [Anaerolineales bacterium]|nr:FGGY-family carbohydrate kinase [Anaerolineales bacterium]